MEEACIYRVSVKGLVVDETGRFMLAREDDGCWDMPGGGIDHGEEPIEGLKRELREETGLEITYISDTPKYFLTAPRPNKDSLIANIVYEIKLKNLDFTPSEECQELRFFTVDEAKKENINPNVVKLLSVFKPSLHI